MSSAGPSRRRSALTALATLAALAALGGGLWLAQRLAPPPRPRYLLQNETAVHDFDRALKMSLRLAEQKSGIEHALVLLPRLPPATPIEALAARLYSELKVGARQQGRGVLYLYSAEENLLKIEVGYALEGAIPDLYCRRLEEAAKSYMLSEVPQDYLSELIITTNLKGLGETTRAAPARPGWLGPEFLSGGAGALTQGFRRTLADYQRAVRTLPAADWARFQPAADAALSAERYLASLREGIGDPRLPLRTEGSALFRAVVPRGEAQQQRIHEYFTAGGPARLIERGELALYVPAPGHSNLPLVLRRGRDRLWYVDEPKAWAYFHRFENDVNFWVKYADNPFLEALSAQGLPHSDYAVYGTHVATPPPPPYPYSLAAAIAAGERAIKDAPAEASRYAALAELYLYEANWLTPALALYREAERLEPNELSYRWRLVDLYLNTSRVEPMLAEFTFLAARLPLDTQLQSWARDYQREYAALD